MRILYVHHESPFAPRGGLGVHVGELAARVAAAGHDVVVLGVDYHHSPGIFHVVDGKVIPRSSRQEWLYQPGAYRLIHAWGRGIHRARGTPYDVAEECEAFGEALFQACPDEPFDLVHLHDTHLAPVARLAVVRCRAAFVVTAHLSSTISRDNMGLGWNDARALWLSEQESGAYHEADRVIAVSRNYASALADRLLVRDAVAIPNGVDASALGAIGAYFRPQPKHAVFIGRASQSKGVLEIYEAARLLPDWRFTVISSVERELYRDLPIVQAMGETPSNLRWIPQAGFGPERWAWAASACVALMPSHEEPFGIAALEWMALGVPLITSRVDGLAEFCDDRNSWGCEPTAEGIAAALRAWDLDLARVTRARETAIEHSWDRTACDTLEVYHGAVEANSLAA